MPTSYFINLALFIYLSLDKTFSGLLVIRELDKLIKQIARDKAKEELVDKVKKAQEKHENNIKPKYGEELDELQTKYPKELEGTDTAKDFLNRVNKRLQDEDRVTPDSEVGSDEEESESKSDKDDKEYEIIDKNKDKKKKSSDRKDDNEEGGNDSGSSAPSGPSSSGTGNSSSGEGPTNTLHKEGGDGWLQELLGGLLDSLYSWFDIK